MQSITYQSSRANCRVAVVTGANKGIGLEIVKQLAGCCHGITTVVLTARDVKRGTDAVSSLGLANVIFHQLDVLDSLSIHNLADFVDKKFGKLDILVNNAGSSEVEVDKERVKGLKIDAETWLSGKAAAHLVQEAVKHTYEKAEECLNTNFHGVKDTTEALLPLLKLSTFGARIVNISSLRGELQRIPSEDVRQQLRNVETLNEDKLDEIVKRFLRDCKDDNMEAGGWPSMLPAYSISKAAVNAYTRILAKRHPEVKINCVHPGFVSTDLNYHTGTMTVEEGARGPVKCALLPDHGPSGCYFDGTQVASF